MIKKSNRTIEELGLTESTPLAMMTLGQFMAALDIQGFAQSLSTTFNPTPEKRYVYGLRGIRELFHVSIRTAQIYKDTILKEAVYQNGRTIVVDAEKALQLFNERRNGYGRK